MEEKFADSEEYQQKVLSYMLYNPSFCSVATAAVKEENFYNKPLQWFFNKLTTSEIQLTPVTLKEELLKAAREKRIKEENVSNYVSLYRTLIVPPVPAEEEYIKQHMLSFVRRNEIKRAMVDCIELMKTDDWATIQDRVTNAVNAGSDIMTTGSDYFGEYQDRIGNRLTREPARKLSTGIPELDELTYGGIKNKQLGLCVGGTGRGKSIFLQWLARVAILLGKKVVYLTFELSEEDMADRFDSIFAHIKPAGLVDHSSEALKRLSKYYDRFGSSLIIKEYPEDEITVPEIKAYLLQLTAKGFVPDLVLVDYVDLIKPHRNYGDVTQEQAMVIKALRGLSKSMNTRIWTAAQLNRAGMAQETPDETSISGGISRLFTADLAVFMAQTKEEREDCIMRLVLAKNRNGRAGRSVRLDTDFEFLTLMREQVITADDVPKEQLNEETGDRGVLIL
jgi:replicative DNA helicase